MNTQKLLSMLNTQDDLQDMIVGPQWWQQNHSQSLAIYMESAELIDHIGYKWWKHHEPNYEAATMELVDLWHFCLNIFLGSVHLWLDELEEAPVERQLNRDSAMLGVVREIEKLWDQPTPNATIQEYATTLGIDAVASEKVNVMCLKGLGERLDADFDRIYVLYMAKNALNRFRGDHGYKDGTYVKHWPFIVEHGAYIAYSDEHTVEDNEIVEHIVAKEGYTSMQEILVRLEKLYKKAL